MELSIENVSFSYDGSKNVLDDINIRSDSNESVAIVGTSGSGKSTLLRLLAGIYPNKKQPHFKGKILIDGISPQALCASGKLGFMFQDSTLLPNLTVRENIEFPTKLSGRVDNNSIKKLMETVGLDKYADFLPSQLSGGMKTRVSLARTFSTKPQLLLLDEPFSSLDVKWRFSLYKELDTLRVSNHSKVLIVTHDIQEALTMANNIFVFGASGRIIGNFKVKDNNQHFFSPDRITTLKDEFMAIQQIILEDHAS